VGGGGNIVSRTEEARSGLSALHENARNRYGTPPRKRARPLRITSLDWTNPGRMCAHRGEGVLSVVCFSGRFPQLDSAENSR
jgi:hypothetical protein